MSDDCFVEMQNVLTITSKLFNKELSFHKCVFCVIGAIISFLSIFPHSIIIGHKPGTEPHTHTLSMRCLNLEFLKSNGRPRSDRSTATSLSRRMLIGLNDRCVNAVDSPQCGGSEDRPEFNEKTFELDRAKAIRERNGDGLRQTCGQTIVHKQTNSMCCTTTVNKRIEEANKYATNMQHTHMCMHFPFASPRVATNNVCFESRWNYDFGI